MSGQVFAFTMMPWTAQAACKGHNTAWWYSDTPDHQRKALAICSGCPVKAECLDAGIARNEDGIWGGTLPIDRGRKRWNTGNTGAPVPLVELVCAHCGNTFLRPANGRGRKLYCDRTCVKNASRDRCKPPAPVDATTDLFQRLRASVEALP